MGEWLIYLREFNTVSVVLRLLLAMLFGGVLGIERAKKGRAAGFRTYMFVCMGAALAVLLSQYENLMLQGPWYDIASELGVNTDVSRVGAQVINGIGFLGTGTIIVTGKQAVKGLTTAAGLWASACMGLAIGAGFYECVFLSFFSIVLSIQLLPYLEAAVIERAKNMDIYMEFTSIDAIGDVITKFKEQGVQIYSVDLDRGEERYAQRPNAVFSVRLRQHCDHEQIMTAVFDVMGVTMIDEI